MDWTVSDFVTAGALVTGTLLLFALATWRAPRHRAVIGAVIAVAFVYVWLELAVGVFTDLGS